MFGIDFYPTPRELIETMIDKVDFKGVKAILEPSAGKGDIAECLRDNEFYCPPLIKSLERGTVLSPVEKPEKLKEMT